MQCQQCTKEASTSFKTIGAICNDCFCASVEKRVRRTERFDPEQPIKIFDDGLKARVLVHILRKILNGPWKIETTKNKEEANVLPSSVDDEAAALLEAVLQGKAFTEVAKKPLKYLTNEEILSYAKINNIHGILPEKNKLQKLLDQIEMHKPGAKVGLVKSLSE